MAAKLSPIPSDRPQLSVILNLKGGQKALAWYQEAFGAEVSGSYVSPDGVVGHAELRIGSAWFAISDEFPEYGALAPETIGGSPVMLHLYVENVDEAVARAVKAGATAHEPVSDQFYGDRGGKITDPFGHRWWLASRVEEVSIPEMKKRAQALFGMS